MLQFAVLKVIDGHAIVGYEDGKVGTVRVKDDVEENPLVNALWKYNTLKCDTTNYDVIEYAATGQRASIRKFPTWLGIIRAAYLPSLRAWFVKGDVEPWPVTERDFVEGRG